MEVLGSSERPYFDIDSDFMDVWGSDMSNMLLCETLRTSSSSSEVSELDAIWHMPDLNPESDECKDHHTSQVIKNDKLLTDSLGESHDPSSSSSAQQIPNIEDCQLQQGIPIKLEPSLTLGLTVGSDGESLPESPGSINEDVDNDFYLSGCMVRSSGNGSVYSNRSKLDLQDGSAGSSISSGSMCGSVCAEADSDDRFSVKDEPVSRPSTPCRTISSVLKPPAKRQPVLQPIVVKNESGTGPSTNFLVNSNGLLRKNSAIRPSATAAIFLSPNYKKPRIELADAKLVNVKVEHDSGSSSDSGGSSFSILDTRSISNSTNGSSARTKSISGIANSAQSFTVIRATSSKCHSGIARSGNTTKVIFGQAPVAATRHPIQTSLISYQPKGAIGELCLTEEEKRTLVSEGYPIPQRLPLTKSEEKSLKKIRRKIKNKISAQESRRKKKEYMDTLEKRMESFSLERESILQELSDLKMELKSLKAENETLKAIVTKCGITYAI